MELIRNIIGYITSFLFITWGSNNLYVIITNIHPSGGGGIGGTLVAVLIALFRLIVGLILIIPTILYQLLHMILFSTDPKTDSSSMLYIIVPSAFLLLVFKIFRTNIESIKERREEKERQKRNAFEAARRKKETEEESRIAKEFEKMNNASQKFYDHYKKLNPLILSTNSWSHINYYNDIYDSFITLKNHCSDNKDWINFYKILDDLIKRLKDLENWANSFSENGKDDNEEYFSQKEEKKESDPYIILGVNREMSNQEIKVQYRKKMHKYHSDKVEHLGDEFKTIAEEKSKEIINAFRKIKEERNIQ